MATVLIVDDEPDLQAIIQFRLQRDGHTVLTANDGQQGVQVARANHPDLIILDVMMPVMDGFEALRHLKEDETTSTIPVLMLTAKSDYQSVSKGWHMDAENYLTKPFEIEELANTINEVLRYRGRGEEGGE